MDLVDVAEMTGVALISGMFSGVVFLHYMISRDLAKRKQRIRESARRIRESVLLNGNNNFRESYLIPYQSNCY